MVKNAIIKELLNKDRKALRTLNKAYGYDFEKDFTAVKIDGSFTINKVLKTIDRNPSNTKIVTIIEGVKPWDNDKLYAVEITGTGNSDYDVDGLRCKCYGGRLDYMIGKGTFNEYRKSCGGCYIIAQDTNNLGRVYKDTMPDLTERLTKAQQDYCNSWRFNRYNRTSRIFDKSGYYLNDKRDNLARRAEKLRKDRQAAAFKATDNAATIKALQEQLNGLKAAIVERLNIATTSAQIKDIEKSLSWYKGLGDCFSKFEYIEKGEKEKSFGSIDTFNKRVDDLTANIEELKKGVA